MTRSEFLRASLAAAAGWMLPLPRAVAAGRAAYDFWLTRLMYESGDWDVDARMPSNIADALLQYTTLRSTRLSTCCRYRTDACCRRRSVI